MTDRTTWRTRQQLEQAWLGRSQGYAAACARKNDPALLSNLTTLDSVRDMDSIRQALGQQQINYYGFSYGTYLGQVYGTMFPERVRRMVLDSNVDPRRVWYPAQLDQDRAFDRNIGIYFKWIAKYDDLFHLGATEQAVENLYYSQLAELDAHPAGGLIGPDEWTDIFLGAGYYIFGWEDIANAFAAWVHDGDWKPLKALYDSAAGVGNDNGFAVYLGVQCIGRPLATELREMAGRQPARLRQGALLDVGQHLVQRAVPLLARTVGDSGQRRRVQGAERAAAGRDARRGDAVRGQPRSPC